MNPQIYLQFSTERHPYSKLCDAIRKKRFIESLYNLPVFAISVIATSLL